MTTEHSSTFDALDPETGLVCDLRVTVRRQSDGLYIHTTTGLDGRVLVSEPSFYWYAVTVYCAGGWSVLLHRDDYGFFDLEVLQ